MVDKAPDFDSVKPTPQTVRIELPARKGPGRPKGSTTKSAPTATAVNADVRQALATLESLYNMVGLGLGAFGLTETLGKWIEQTERLKATNEDALKAAPKVAKFLASTGTAGGSATFLITHAMAFGTVALVAREEVAQRFPAKDKPVSRETSPDANVTQFPQAADPTLIPGM
jgi:hypothetical protein